MKAYIEIEKKKHVDKCQLCGSSYFVASVVVGHTTNNFQQTNTKALCYRCRKKLAEKLLNYNKEVME